MCGFRRSVERALDHAGQYLVVGQIGREFSQPVQVGVRHLMLDVVPMLRPLFQVVGLHADDLDGVMPGGAWLGSPIEGDTASSTGSSTFAAPRAKS